MKNLFFTVFAFISFAAQSQSGWRVIPSDSNYPTNDIIVAFCSVTDAAYNLPIDTANSDCTGAFQTALNAAEAAGGGTVFVPEGTYRIHGSLTIASNVFLRGRWKPITASQNASGTILALYTTGDSTSIPSMYLTGNGCGVSDLTFWQPNQDASNPTDSPFVIAVEKQTQRQNSIQNITFANVSNGINLIGSNMCLLRGVYGSPLKIGVMADQSAMTSRYADINFSPDYWYWSGLDGSPEKEGPHKTYIRTHGIAVDIREMDDFFFIGARIEGYNKAIILQNGVDDDAWGAFDNITTVDCDNGLYIQNSKFIKVINSTIEGSEYGIYGGDDRTIELTLNNCSISGGVNALKLTTGNAIAVNCTYNGTNDIAADFDFKNNTSSVVIPQYNDTYEKVRKPYTHTLFDVQQFGAQGNGTTSDTQAVQDAIAAANVNGGIVFFPPGKYLIDQNLTIGKGVEIRGSSGGPHISSQRTRPVAEKIGSLIVIAVGKNQANGTPFITLDDDSGIRGIGFHYKDQVITEGFIAYPFMIQANGLKNYIINSSASNPYQAAQLNGDDHLVEYTFFGGLKTTYEANNCDSGRIQNLHIKPDFWGDIFIDNAPRNERTLFDFNASKSLHAIVLNNCTNHTLASIYSQYGKTFVTVNNSSGQALMLGSERFQSAFLFNNGSRTYDLLACANTVNAMADKAGINGYKTLSGFNGEARIFASAIWGFSEETLSSHGGHLYVQNTGIGGFANKGAVNIVSKPGATLTMEACRSDLYLGYDIAGTFNMTKCNFPLGTYSEMGTNYTDNYFDKEYILADFNQNPSLAYGIELDESNTTVVEIDQSANYETGDTRKFNAVALTSGDTFNLDITDDTYTNGKSNRVYIYYFFAYEGDSNVDVYYNSTSGRKLAKSNPVSTTSMGYRYGMVLINDAQFGTAKDLEFEVTYGTVQLTYVVVAKTVDYANLSNSSEKLETFKVYPVPATNILHIEGVDVNKKYEIYNLQGVKIKEDQFSSTGIDISELDFGMYLLKINDTTVQFVKGN
jgi:hypothetical protein